MPHNCCIHKSYFGCRSGYMTSFQSEEWFCLIRHLSILLFLNFSGCCITQPLCFLLSKQFLLQLFSCLSAFGAWYSLLSVTGWTCYFQRCSLSARSMRSFYRAVTLFELHVDMPLASHIDLALRVVTACQRQIWYQIPKVAKVNGRCTLVHFS